MKIEAGSETHKELFRRQFIDTHEVFDPATLAWPRLDEAELARLRGVPFWQEVYHTERRAGAIVDAFTPHVTDPVVREAVALQGVEETRHAKLIRVLLDRYGLAASNSRWKHFPLISKRLHRLRVWRVPRRLPGLRRLQDGPTVRLPARINVPDLRCADV